MKYDSAEINDDVRAEALYLYDSRPDIINMALAKMPADLPRDKAEEFARMTSMSAALSIAAGIPAEVDEHLFLNSKEWMDELDRLLIVHARYAPGAPE